MSSGLLKCRLQRLVLFVVILGMLPWMAVPSFALTSNRYNLESSNYPVIVVSSDPEYGGLVLELLEHSFRYFANTMAIRSFGPMRFKFILEETRPTESNQEMETMSYPRNVVLGEKMEFRVGVPSADFNPVAIVRTAMICQLEGYVLKDRDENASAQFPADPFWLVEGLTQGSLDKKTPTLEKIISRIDRAGPVPSLETVQGWTAASPHRLEQYWQEACCYWLVRQATATGADRDALCSWLMQWYTPQGRAYWDGNGETEVWWKKTLSERSRDKAVVKGEEQTREELQKSLQFQARLKGQDLSQEFNLAKLPPPPLEFTSSKPFEEVMNRLLLLQARGNFLWQDVIESYRTAYAYWLKGKYLDYQKEIAQAESKAQNVATYMSKAREYLNWYEVNHPSPGPKFSTLLRESFAFQDAEALEKRDQAEIAAQLTLIEKGK